MSASNGYAVFFFPQGLEALGEAIKPYLQDSPAGPHVMCNEIDTSGSLLEMTLLGTAANGASVQLELMVPVAMVRMIVSSQSNDGFGFGPRAPAPDATAEAAGERPVVAGDASAAEAAPASPGDDKAGTTT